MPFPDQVAFITGASQGIGRACALMLAEAGAKVAAASRNLEQLQSLAAEVERSCGEAGRVLPIQMDAAEEPQIAAAFDKAQQHFGKVDILVNNAGITRDGLLLRMKRKDWDEVLTTNLTAY